MRRVRKVSEAQSVRFENVMKSVVSKLADKEYFGMVSLIDDIVHEIDGSGVCRDGVDYMLKDIDAYGWLKLLMYCNDKEYIVEIPLIVKVSKVELGEVNIKELGGEESG
jgi:hypothetical protein